LNPSVTNGIFGKDPADLSDSEAAYLAGFFGRDRSDPSGVPNDNPIRTTVGAYPAAGLFDDEPEKTGGATAQGNGIFPMITSWMVKFYLLESMINLGVTVPEHTESSLLRSALQDQMDKVFEVGLGANSEVSSDATAWDDDYDWPIEYTDPSDFIDEVIEDFDAVSGANQRLNFVLKQAWFANFGNGYEMYNAFRRTGLPNDLQAPLQLPRQFALRLPYVQDELNLNSNTPTVVYDSPTDAVFWDVLKFQF
jgi:hypothetical protein